MKHYTQFSFILTLLFMVTAGFLAPQVALGWFSDNETSSPYSITAGTLDIALTSTSEALTLEPGQTDAVVVQLTNNGTVIPTYDLHVVPHASSTTCASLTLSASRNGVLVYSGPAEVFTSDPQTEFGSWEFAVSRGADEAENGTCVIEVQFRAWQGELGGFGAGGFSDVALLSLTIQAVPTPVTGVILNEVYPRSKVPQGGLLRDEWIELHNTGDDPVDVEGWALGERTGRNEISHVISVSHTCTGSQKKGFARVYGGASTVINPGGYLLVQFCANEVLNHGAAGETVTLYDASGAEVDQFSFSSPEQGRSFARDGDTWGIADPTPGTPNTNLTTEGGVEAPESSVSDPSQMLAPAPFIGPVQQDAIIELSQQPEDEPQVETPPTADGIEVVIDEYVDESDIGEGTEPEGEVETTETTSTEQTEAPVAESPESLPEQSESEDGDIEALETLSFGSPPTAAEGE